MNLSLGTGSVSRHSPKAARNPRITYPTSCQHSPVGSASPAGAGVGIHLAGGSSLPVQFVPRDSGQLEIPRRCRGGIRQQRHDDLPDPCLRIHVCHGGIAEPASGRSDWRRAATAGEMIGYNIGWRSNSVICRPTRSAEDSVSGPRDGEPRHLWSARRCLCLST